MDDRTTELFLSEVFVNHWFINFYYLYEERDQQKQHFYVILCSLINSFIAVTDTLIVMKQ